MAHHIKRNHNALGSTKESADDKSWNRRSFLRTLGIVGGGTMMLGGANLNAAQSKLFNAAKQVNSNGRVLVIIQLMGGNDGLNTVIPLNQYDIYSSSRPRLKYEADELTNLSSDFAIPSFLTGFESLWNNNMMKVVHGVGYENSSLSHSKASNIWATLDDSDIITTGMFGRYYQNKFPDYGNELPKVPLAIKIKSQDTILFDGDDESYAFTVSRPNELRHLGTNGDFYNVSDLPNCTYGQKVSFLRETMNTAFEFSSDLFEAYDNSENSVAYKNSNFGRDLASIARFIKSDIETQVYIISLDGFDTHSKQVTNHKRVLTDLSDNLKIFFDDLSNSDHDKKVLAMTTSEFGRSVKENPSGGTEHGTAAPLFLFGPALGSSGFVGNHPDLSDLDFNGNLKNTTDFRSVYSTVLSKWLCFESTELSSPLLGKTYDNLELGFNCDGIDLDDETLDDDAVFQEDNNLEKEKLSHMVLYNEGKVSLRYEVPIETQIEITIYDMAGRNLGVIENKLANKGVHIIDIKSKILGHLSQGNYIYRITTFEGSFGKVFLIP